MQPATEPPILRLEVAREIDDHAACVLAAWLKENAPAEVVECFIGMRALETFALEAHHFGGLVSAHANTTILHSLGSVVNALSVLEKQSSPTP